MKGIGLLALIIPTILVAGLIGYSVIQNMSPAAQTSTSLGTTTSSASVSNSITSADLMSVGSSTDSSSATPAGQICSTAIGVNSTHGLTLQTYLPANVTIGGVMCIKTTVKNNNQTSISSLSGSVMITNSMGQKVFEDTLVPFQAGSVTLTTGNQISFQYIWNTTYPYQGVTPRPGTFTLKVIVQFDGLQPMTYIESDADFTISA